MLGQRADAIGVERPALADLAEQLAGAAHLAGLGILEHEHEQFVAELVLVAGEGGVGALELGAPAPRGRAAGW